MKSKRNMIFGRHKADNTPRTPLKGGEIPFVPTSRGVLNGTPPPLRGDKGGCKQYFQRTVLILLLVLFFFVSGGKYFVAQAQDLDVDIPTGTAQITQKEKHEIKKSFGEKFKAILWRSTTVAAKNALKTFLTQMAYDAAVYLASQGPGGKPVAWSDLPSGHIDKLVESAGADALQTFSQDFLGFDICNPNIQLKLAFVIGVGREQRPRKPKCEWSKIRDNWKKITEEDGWSDKVALSLEPQQNDIGIGLSMYQSIFNEQSQAEKDATFTRLITGSFKDGVDEITKEIEAPFEGASNLYKSVTDKMDKAETTFFGDIAVDTVSVFTNTLFAKGMENLIKRLLKKDATQDLFNPEGDAVAEEGGVPAAEARFAEFKTVDYQAPTDLDIVTEFEQCPTPIASLNNCTIDTKFAQAIREKLTVQQAIDKGLLHQDWPIGFTQFTGGTNLVEYTQPRSTEGYSYNAIKRLRLYRVVPLGWEIAAEKIGSQLKTVFTLREVVEGFNTQGGQFYHLIDPQWVLKIPPQECLLAGASSMLQNFNTRIEYCADVRTCLKEGPDGTCETKFGYCTREKNIWQLDGDSCPSYYNSCKSFTKTSDNNVSPLLQYTVDFDSCTVDNVGCQWYSMTQDENDEWREELSQENRNYFNQNIEQCDAKSDGCSLFVRSQDTFGTNLVRNASFEEIFDFEPQEIDDPNNTEQFLGWRWGEGEDLMQAYAVSDSLTGSVALQLPASLPPAGPFSLQGLNPVDMIDTGYPLAERTFTLSFYAKNCKAYDSETGTGSYFKILSGTTQAIQDTEEWQGYTTSLYFPPGMGQRTISFDIFGEAVHVDPGDPTQNRLCTIDAVKLEEGASPSSYVDYGRANQVGLKQPPEYLGCVGSPTDALECGKYAKVCSETEVGCNLFMPESYQGAPISGTARGSDMCPEACVGYRTYKQSANYFESSKFPVHFIADTAKECSAVEESCSEFTNLDELARTGAEKREYYQQLQQCRRPDDSDPGLTQGVYYTWEGSERTGYNLRIYRLVSAEPYRDQGEVVDAETSPAPPAYIAQRGVEENFRAANQLIEDLIAQCNKDTYDAKTAPSECLKFYDVDGKIAYRMASYLIVISDDCHPVRKTRYISSPEECAIYDRSTWLDGTHCNVEENDCIASGGTWNNAQIACVYQAIPSQSAQCQAQMNGCREYRGNLSYTTRQALQENFEDNPELNLWRGDYEISSEAPIAGQHSLKVSNGVSTLKIPVTHDLDKETSEVNDIYLLSFTVKGSGNLKIYFEDFNNEGQYIPWDINKGFSNGQLALTNDWRPVALGPVVIDKKIGPLSEGGEVTSVDLVFELVPTGGDPFFLDDISLQETTDDTFYLIRESWQTPEICDQNPSLVPAPQYYLGCEAYTTVQDEAKNLKSFTSLCASDKAGCEALVNTQNSTSPWSATYNAFCELTQGKCSNDPSEGCSNDGQCAFGPKGLNSGACVFCSDPNGCACEIGDGGEKECDVKEGQKICRYNRSYNKVNFAQQDTSTEVVEEDDIAYLVNTQDARCDVNIKGCTMMGLPEISLAGEGVEEVNGFDTVFKKDDPDKYRQILCSQEFQGCEEYKHGSERYYFKDPEDRICERKTVPGGNEEKWYQKYKVCEGGSADGTICYGRGEEDQCVQDGGICEQKTCSPQVEDFSVFAEEPRKSGVCVSGENGNLSPRKVKTCESDLDCDQGDVCKKQWAYACEEQYDQCTAFIDGLDATRYYNLDNKRVDRSSCSGLVSQKDGCVLLSNSNIVEAQEGPVQHLYSSIATYQLSESQNNKAVSPVDCDNEINIEVCESLEGRYEPKGVCDGGDADGYECRTGDGDCPGGSCEIEYWGICRFAERVVDDQVVLDENINGITCRDSTPCGNGRCTLKNDSNEIVKVRRDRMCGEWLDCLSEFRVEGTEQAGSGIEQSTCAVLARCRGNDINQPFTCNEIVTGSCATSADCHDVFGPRSTCVDNRCTATLLSEGDYKGRDTSWAGMEYSGYSLYRKYPLDEVTEVVGLGRCRLELTEKSFDGSLCRETSDCATDYVCDFEWGRQSRLAFITSDGAITGVDGRTYTPETSHSGDFSPSIVPNSCRLFPEDDAPFDKSVTDQKYRDVYRCYGEGATGENNWACECSYKKLDAGGARIYVGKDTEPKDADDDVAIGVCVNTKDPALRGKLCSTKSPDCGSKDDGSSCQVFTEEEVLYGMQGYCLEKDLGWHINGTKNPEDFACLTWYPVGLVGGFDPFSFAPEGGYTPASNRQDYCVEKASLTESDPYKMFVTIERAGDIFTNAEAPDNPYLFSVNSGQVACNEEESYRCDTSCTNNEPDERGAYAWCWAPPTGLLGCYEMADNNGDGEGNYPNDGLFYSSQKGGWRKFLWNGPKIYRHQTSGIRFMFVLGGFTISSWDGSAEAQRIQYNDHNGAGCPVEVDNFGNAWQDVELLTRVKEDVAPADDQNNVSFNDGVAGTCGEGYLACIDLSEADVCDKGIPERAVAWDTDGCKGDGEQASLWGGGGFIRFKVNWASDDATCDDEGKCFFTLASMELWAGDDSGEGVFEVMGINVFNKDACGATVTVVDNNMFGGPNTKAFTNRLWDDEDREVVPGAAPSQYNKECVPFGAVALDNPYNGNPPGRENRVIQYTGGNVCSSDITHVQWGNADGEWKPEGWPEPRIFSLFGSAQEKYVLEINEAHADSARIHGHDPRSYDFLYMTPKEPTKKYDHTYAMALFQAPGIPYPEGEEILPGPQVYSVDKDTEGEGEGKTISLNEITGDDGVNNIIGDVILPVEMKFFAYDDTGNYMPLREFIIDWDVATQERPDEGKIVFQGSYKNFKAVGGCNGADFGSSEDGCIERPFRISYLYTCDDANSPGWGRYGQSGKCAFRPRVQVKNNWGWTNVADLRPASGDNHDDDPPDAAVDGNLQTPDIEVPSNEKFCRDHYNPGNNTFIMGCYCGDDPTDGVRDGEGKTVCEREESKQPWTYYEGLVIVEPPPQ